MNKQKKLPFYKPTPFNSIKEMMEIAVREAGDRTAFRYKDGTDVVDVTYNEFQCETLFLGTALHMSGISGMHVAIIAENSYKWICVYLTMLKSSGVFIPVDKDLPKSDIVNVLDDSEAKVVFYSKKYETLAQTINEENDGKFIFIGLDLDEDKDRFLSYDKLIERGAEAYRAGNLGYVNEISDPSNLKMLVYTSGTTGMAKGVMLSEHNLISVVYYGMMIITPHKSCLSVLPYNHTYEAVTGLLANIHNHSVICLNDSIKYVSSNINLFKPEFIFLVPAFLEVFYKKINSNIKKSGNEKRFANLLALSNKLRKRGIDMRRRFFSAIHKSFGGNLKTIICGGAPLRTELADFFDSIGITVVNGYGITECSPLISANREPINDPSTVGVPIPCLNVKIMNADKDGIGEICVKGDVVMLGYYKNKELTSQVIDSDGYFHTGDFGKLREDGLLMITGRKKNLIVLSNGKNVFPEEIEQYIQSIQYIDEIIVYGTQNKSLNTEICAEVYISPENIKEITEKSDSADVLKIIKKDIESACGELPSYKLPAKIILRKNPFDKTTSNKIKRLQNQNKS